MCGIAGIFDLKGTRDIDRAALQRMNDAMINRGPDGEGFFHAPGIGFAHRRLAIIDIEGGQQPFTTQDKRSVLTFNGEIYNYQDLSEALTDEVGMTLRTKSDTEALAELWNVKGASCLEDLLGMFAFGLWNKEDKTLTLARDRLGERPLYYAQTPDGWLLFASDINAIMASGMIEAKMRADAVADYFALGYVPDPKAIYENVFKLPPAHTLTICQGLGSIPQPEAYWSVHFRPDEQMSEAESLSKLTELLDKAVSSQMISDVPLGAFLSGGVDSSAIVASMSHAHRGKVKTCSIGFKEASHDEREFAQMIADRYETDHREKVISLDAHSLIDTIAKAYGEPFADSSALPSYLVCQMARETVTVALSGDGGDELFAGYRRYPMFRREEQMKKALQGPKGNIKAATQIFGKIGDVFPKLDWAPRPFRLKTTLQSIGDTTANAYLRAVSTSLPDRLEKMTSASFHADLDGYHVADRFDALIKQAKTEDPVSLAQFVDLHTWLPGRMLTKVDRAAMANSLEVRPPMLDYRFVEWAARLPDRLKFFKDSQKHILKIAMEPRVPQEVLYRQKQGFGLPVTEWLRAETNNPLDRLTKSTNWADSGYLNTDHIKAMMSDHKAGKADYAQELWSVIMFEAFLDI